MRGGRCRRALLERAARFDALRTSLNSGDSEGGDSAGVLRVHASFAGLRKFFKRHSGRWGPFGVGEEQAGEGPSTRPLEEGRLPALRSTSRGAQETSCAGLRGLPDSAAFCTGARPSIRNLEGGGVPIPYPPPFPDSRTSNQLRVTRQVSPESCGALWQNLRAGDAAPRPTPGSMT